MTTRPSKWWFVIPLPVALVVSFVIWLVRGWFMSSDPSNTLQHAPILAIVGVLFFPIGLPNAVGCSPSMMGHNLFFFLFWGYVLYFALSTIGMLRQTTAILILLIALLILNMVGCQLENRVFDFWADGDTPRRSSPSHKGHTYCCRVKPGSSSPCHGPLLSKTNLIWDGSSEFPCVFF